jgi:catechol 2,3-dioxygenase-like lactoylglutathione lyase family enzyme
MGIYAIDHLVLTVCDAAATRRFHVEGLGLALVTFAGGRSALQIGVQKINLHHAGREFEPKAARPTPGSGDFCLLTDEGLGAVADRMAALGYPVELGPVPRAGATGPLESVYFRDPDGSLVEVARPLSGP